MPYRLVYGKANLAANHTDTRVNAKAAQIGCRFLIGIGVGLASCVAPLYIQELSPTRQRGRMVVLNVVMITGGQVVAYGIGWYPPRYGGMRSNSKADTLRRRCI